MNIEDRIERLEDRIGITDEVPPLIVINAKDCSKNSTDPGTPSMAIVPGQINRPGIELSKDQGETPEEFLGRAEKAYSEFYGNLPVAG